MKMKCIIVDDDEFTRKAVEVLVSKAPVLELAAVCDSAKEAMRFIKQGGIDILFLDIEMPGMSGLQLLEALGNSRPQVIFITSKKEYAVAGFDFNVTDFLSKPVQLPRFFKAVAKAKKIQEEAGRVEQDSSLFVKTGSKFVKILFTDLLFVEGLGDYVIIHTGSGKHTVHVTMKEMEKRLGTKDFMRVHLSYIIRLDKIAEIKDHTLMMGKHEVPVSRSHRKELISRLNLV